MKFLRILALLFLLSFGSTIVFVQLMGGGLEGAATSVTIESGMNVRDVADALKDHGVITSAMAFRLYLKTRGLDTSIQPGALSIPEGASFSEIADLLVKSADRQMTITIPEGYTVSQIDALLAEKGLIEAGEIITCARECDFETFDFLPSSNQKSKLDGVGTRLEGYLFPDTYFVDHSDFVPKFFIERLLGTFRQRVMVGLESDLESSVRSLEEIVIMSSLIERETRTSEERSVVSGILWKREDAGRGLDVDATVRYVLGKETGALTKADLEVDSAYNTRRYAGMPPGPIANPGLASIKAALHPSETEYWYYLHGKDGAIRYAETNEEHNVNKARYL